ncbi:low-specificity L-threonine aldolase [Paenibacillus thiaminolyticus]|uniref:Low-specificity L-threonine aldolase n=1 Tax=Paenibacillus thiaminolyticus TaxID=49283 RepID=A0AAP9DR41_PANTH|nr:low-specificity L-threonine aldolase [Paenibacillus thiaminolyticus]MCY9538541.1 low-specificity L-threonine aldolase [Paenibacillus thiaminolyticus]MCY9600595.1 low-specificity L-threonine aldolase [Paenibacillus thiaminolyticus]MCY9608391.1 low-specificity L-threonine aldolase [Paenibacillus thiaminolyticus]MCY9614800.1 low-specificity L-threonine aldolase [Paenibacillus thiaminolyticus]MCY9619908.1 low-specificity L-threonine aldolase [Paenibacillus thiaminolyticus]
MRQVIELRSDTFTLPTRRMIEAIQEAALGDDVYGEDPTVRQLEQEAARQLGKEAAILMPSGTMANLASLMAHCPRGSKAIVGDETDIYIYEAGGASVCGGIMYEPIPTLPDGRLAIADLERAFPLEPEDPQFALPALISLENPHNRMGGRVLPLAYLEEVRAFANAKAVPIHMDGARLFNAAVALGTDAAEIARYADSVQICLSKGLSAPIGSIVTGTEDFIRKVYRLRKMLGGGMRQAGIIAAPGLVGLEQMTDRLAADHAHALRLARGLADIPGIVIQVEDVETNIVFFRIEHPAYTWQTFIEAAHARGLRVAELGHGRIRAVTHSGIQTADIDEALRIVRELLTDPAV